MMACALPAGWLWGAEEQPQLLAKILPTEFKGPPKQLNWAATVDLQHLAQSVVPW